MTGVGELTVSPAGRRPSEYHWLLPAELRDPVDQPRERRSTRDWIVDSVCFVMALGWAVLIGLDLLRPDPALVPQWTGTPAWLAWSDLLAGVALTITLWWRRRFPVRLAVLAMALAAFSVAATVAAMIMCFTVAVHRRFTVTAVIGLGALCSNVIFCALRPERGTAVLESLAW